jgi:hypothetical protein
VIARTVRFARAASATTSIVALVGFNLLPLVGVLFLRWNVMTILVLYWVENGIVGLLNVPKMLLAAAPDEPATRSVDVRGLEPVTVPRGSPVAKAALVSFFLVHYGIFWLVHGVFVFALPMFAGIGGFTDFRTLPDGTVQFYDSTVADPNWSAVAFGAVGLAISHGTSFVVNFLGRREYLRVTIARQMFAPYGRLVILHLTILFGAFVSLTIGSPIGAVIVLVLLKTGLDLWLHLREHGRLQPGAATG